MQLHNLNNFALDHHHDGFTIHDGDIIILHDKLYRCRIIFNHDSDAVEFARLLTHDEFSRNRHPSAHNHPHDRPLASIDRLPGGVGSGTVSDVRRRRRSDPSPTTDATSEAGAPPPITHLIPPPIPVWGLEYVKEGGGDHDARNE